MNFPKLKKDYMEVTCGELEYAVRELAKETSKHECPCT